MSGHSKWSTIKRKKEALDQKRGAEFTKLSNMIKAAVKTGGGIDPEVNFKLKLAIQKAKASSMPSDNIQRSINRAAGISAQGTKMESITYEGYGPGGVAIMVETTTDNRNRTAADIRHRFSKKGGSMGEAGCVGWMFEPKGVISLLSNEQNHEELLLQLMEIPGVLDLQEDADEIILYTMMEDFDQVVDSLEVANIETEDAKISLVPKNTVQIQDASVAKQILNVIEFLEESEDVEAVYANFDISDEIMTQLSQE